jgi:hypothetical protein
LLGRIVEGELSVSDLHRLRAPRENGAILAEPSLAEAGRLLAHNRKKFNQASPDILNRSWADLRLQARREILVAARDYLVQAGEPIPDFTHANLILAGHQPDLFHPGVWIKNFTLNGLARTHRATPLNLIVDSDAAKTLFIRLPVCQPGFSPRRRDRIDPSQTKMVSIPLDRWTGEVPYEELRVADETTFIAVKEEVVPLLRAWGFEPMFGPYWQEVLRQSTRTKFWGERLAAARRTFERTWGCHNLELPVSRMCQTESFAWFTCHLLAHLPHFHEIYNGSIRGYRERYGLRSESHPVPELTVENGWLETPFWAWRANQPQRRPLFARLSGAGIELRVENETILPVPLQMNTDPTAERAEQAVKAWRELEGQGIKIRSRALMTTLFARLFVGELFIHGIGGGKYDELTDEIIRHFYRMDPPDYLVLSGTLHLPLPTFPNKRPDCRQLAHELRDLRWNPQRHVEAKAGLADQFNPSALPEWRDLAAQKEAWIARQPGTAVERRRRFQEIRDLTDKIRPLVVGREHEVQEILGKCDQEIRANMILQNREYAFCLHPEETLRPFLTQFL